MLLKKAADQIINSSMELGGNAPFIVFDDADLDKAVEGAMVAKMRNGGEACTAANRFYVQRGIAEAFSKKFAAAMSALKVDDGVNATTDCGPMVNAKAINTIARLVDDAVAKKAQVLCGGQKMARRGYFFERPCCSTCQKTPRFCARKSSGPSRPVNVFDTEAEAIALANDTEYGLVSYVYTADLTRALRVAEKLEAGMIALIRGLVSDPAAPFGGVKQSGLGREGAHHGILEFMEAKYIAASW